MSRKGDEVQSALEAAMKAKLTAELDELDDFWGPFLYLVNSIFIKRRGQVKKKKKEPAIHQKNHSSS